MGILQRRLSSTLPRSHGCNFIKIQTPTQVFSCAFCEIFKNAFFTDHLRTRSRVLYMTTLLDNGLIKLSEAATGGIL